MAEQPRQITRFLVAAVAAACFALAILLWFVRPEATVLSSAFARVGLLMIAVWIGSATQHRKAAWTGVSPTTFIVIALVLLALTRLPLRFLIPAGVLLAGIGTFLRPKEKYRPPR